MDETARRLYATEEDYEAARARFSWDDGDVRWPDGKGGYYTTEQVLQMQSDARKAEAAVEREKARIRHGNT